MKRRMNWSSGLTLMELSAVLIVVGIIAFGLTVGFRGVMHHYAQDKVKQDIRHYGNTLMREITIQMNQAEKIERDTFNGYARIKIYQDKYSSIPDVTITGTMDEGILFDGVPALEGNLVLPINGPFRDKGRREITLEEFTVTKSSDPRPSLGKFNSAYLNIELVLELTTNTFTDGHSVDEEIVFNRTVFLSRAYLLS